MWAGCAAQLNALAKIPSIQYRVLRFTACPSRAGWFGRDQCNLLSSWPNLLSAPSELMPITQFCGSKRSSPCSPEGRCSCAFTVLLMTLSALAQGAQVTYSPHWRDWLLKKLSTSGGFFPCDFICPLFQKIMKKGENSVAQKALACLVLSLGKMGIVGHIFQMLVAENTMHEKGKKEFFSSWQY